MKPRTNNTNIRAKRVVLDEDSSLDVESANNKYIWKLLSIYEDLSLDLLIYELKSRGFKVNKNRLAHKNGIFYGRIITYFCTYIENDIHCEYKIKIKIDQ